MALPNYERNFKGAIRLSNWLKAKHWYSSKGDPVNIAMGGVSPAFLNAVQNERKKYIEVHYRTDLATTSICIEREKSFQILIPESFNSCHRRFALCKELCHVLTDDAHHRCHDPDRQIGRTLTTGMNVRNSVRDGELCPLFTLTELESEDFCFLLAMEIVIPVSKRDQIMADVKISAKKTHYQVATELMIPQSLVRFFTDSPYHTEFKRLGGETLLIDPRKP